jgi:hypothetical protein
MTPDLLLSGVMFFAISLMASPRWTRSRRLQFAAGIVWGAAYLTKAVAFPVAFGLGIGMGSLWVVSRAASLKAVVRSLGATLLGFMLLAAPWVIVLSWKYQSLSFHQCQSESWTDRADECRPQRPHDILPARAGAALVG